MTDSPLLTRLLERLRQEPRSFWVKVTLDGGATWFVRTGTEAHIAGALPAGQTVSVIVRSDEYSLTALVDGKLTWADALVAERVSLSGDVSLIAALQSSLSG